MASTLPLYKNENEIKNHILNNYCICRCCLRTNAEFKPIFNPIGSIPQAIFIFTSIKIEENDNLPKTICTNCIDHLNNCVSFKQKVESSDLLLRKLQDKSTGPQKHNGTFMDHDYAKSDEDRNEAAHDPTLTNNYSPVNHLSCHLCCKNFSDQTSLNNHQLCHQQNQQTKFSCFKCQLNFMAKEDLFVHNSLHDDSHNGIQCRSCDKKFTSFFKLKRHIPSHFKYKPFKCKLCGKRFVEMSSLTRHFRVHTGEKPESLHVCNVCQKDFPSPYTLKVHMRRHTGELPWKCDVCDKGFYDFRLLRSHKRLHVENKPFECKQCRKSFRHRSTLVTHMKVHTTNSNRPFRCDKCKKAFKKFYRLEIHKRQAHNKRFVCTQCCQVFASSVSLEDHLQWHSKRADDEEPKETPSAAAEEFFQCNDCTLQFSSRLDLITHQKLKHTLHRHECFTCFGKWKTIEELIEHKCGEVLKDHDEPEADEMILMPNGQLQDCSTIVDALLASVSTERPSTATNEKNSNKK